MADNKKLIEVALPLEKINEESAREKAIRHGHPSTLHLWWARRPLAAVRAVIWASLVDDPSAHPEEFSTEEEQNAERQRLFRILEDLVVWENSDNEEVLNEAKKEILKSTCGEPPTLLDPFAGGGAIPLEAQRLGLNAYAYDLNPVAVTINKAMIEIPSRFIGNPPVNPEDQISCLQKGWVRDDGLAKDIKYYGKRLKEEAYRSIGYLYPKMRISGGKEEATAVAWIWARTVQCPNPACHCKVPLTRTFNLSTKKGAECHIVCTYENEEPSFRVEAGILKSSEDGTVTRKGARCLRCGEPISFDYIREEGQKGEINSSLMAIVCETNQGRLYCAPTKEQEYIADVPKPENTPLGDLPKQALGFRVQAYGIHHYYELFSNRQLTMLTTFSSILPILQNEIEKDAIAAGLKNDHISLNSGGNGAKAYAEAIIVYLAFVIDKMADYNSSFCSWHNSGEKIRNTFGRQAIPMVWDYAEANPFSNSSGSFDNMLKWVYECVEQLPASSEGTAKQFDAQEDCGLRNVMVSTDPPYYDNIGYADLSDYFYVWMRQSLKDIYPKLFNTVLTPKEGELIATPYRHKGSAEEAKEFFENGMLYACKQIYKYATNDIPVTIYYAYKQDDYKGTQKGSSGWETMLSAIVNAGFTITGTWPIRTEMANRSVASGTNALASSIVLVCRKRSTDAPQTTRRNLINILHKEIRPALRNLQGSNIAPVDLAQSAIGPGMAVYSRYSQVLEADGTPMTVRSALQVINEEIDLYFNEQVGSIDAESRFCVDLYTQYAYNDIKYGEAEVLANAKGVTIPSMVSNGVLYAKAGIVHLIERKDLPEKINSNENNIWLLTQQLTYAMEQGGINACARIVASMFGSNAEDAKDLAYRLYTIADQKKWNNEAYAYNALVVSWPDIQAMAAEYDAKKPEQISLFDLGLNDN